MLEIITGALAGLAGGAVVATVALRRLRVRDRIASNRHAQLEQQLDTAIALGRASVDRLNSVEGIVVQTFTVRTGSAKRLREQTEAALDAVGPARREPDPLTTPIRAASPTRRPTSASAPARNQGTDTSLIPTYGYLAAGPVPSSGADCSPSSSGSSSSDSGASYSGGGDSGGGGGCD